MTKKTAPTITSCWIAHLVTLGLVTLLAGCGGHPDPVELFENGNYDAAFRIFSKQAAAGDVIASNYLGTHYYLGAGVPRDFVRAAQLYEVAALAEYADAQRNLGIMYLRGLGVEKDYHQAYGWLYHAHAGGNKGANDYLTLMSDNVTPNASQIARKRVRQQIEAQAVATSNRKAASK
jgi:TPR repeat protein